MAMAPGTVERMPAPVGGPDFVPLVAVAAGLMLLVLAILMVPTAGRPWWIQRAVQAAVRLRACRSFARAVARGEMDAAERLASKTFASAEGFAARSDAFRKPERR